MILSDRQVAALKTAVEDALLARGSFYDATLRLLLARGMPQSFLLGIHATLAPGPQLELDLTSFNRVGRLSDGTVPLETWLRNALGQLQTQQQATVIQEMLDLVSKRINGVPLVEVPTAPDMPPSPPRPAHLEQQAHRDDTLPFARHDLAAGPLFILRWLLGLPTAGSIPATEWRSFNTRVRRNRMEDDFWVSGSPAGGVLETSCQRGDFGESGRKASMLSCNYPSPPVLYRLPEHEFRRGMIRYLELSYDLVSKEVRVRHNQDLVAACRLG